MRQGSKSTRAGSSTKARSSSAAGSSTKARSSSTVGSSAVVRCLALAAILGAFVFSGCVMINGNFKYKGTRVEVETLDLGGIGVVEFLLGSEDVIVVTEEKREAEFKIEKTYRANDREYGEELLDKAEILFERRGERLVVKRKKERDLGLSQVTKGYVSIDIEVGLPAEIELDVNTGSGDVKIGDRGGQVSINTGSGDVKVGEADGGLDVDTGSGDVTVSAARHAVKLSTGSGDVVVGGIGGEAVVHTGSGDVTVGKVAGDVDVGTGSGDVEVENSMGKIGAHTSSGDVDVPHHTGSADIGTSSGDVMLGLYGGEGDIMVKTSSGEVDMTLYGGDAYEVDVETGSGSISSHIPLTIRDASRRRLSGQYGTGGFSITIKTSSGSVLLTKGAV